MEDEVFVFEELEEEAAEPPNESPVFELQKRKENNGMKCLLTVYTYLVRVGILHTFPQG